MRKILVVCEAFGGGVFAYVTQLCNGLCGRFEVALAYSVRPQTPPNYRELLDRRVRLFEIADFGCLSRTPNVIKELRRVEREVKPDVIHLHSSIAGGIGRLAFGGKKNTVVYTPHGYAFILMGSGWKSGIYRMAEHILGRMNFTTLTCCESEDRVARTLCKRTAYIETGLDLDAMDTALAGIEPARNGCFTVAAVGRLCTQKQPQIFNQIARMLPEARFLWIGEGELAPLLTAPNIQVTGWLPRRETLALLMGADAFILCSLGEAVAMSLLEAMYLKKLCLVSDVMGNRSVIRDGINGYVCGRPEEYIRRLKDAMAHFPTQLSEQAHRDVREIYNAQVMLDHYVSFYSQIT